MNQINHVDFYLKDYVSFKEAKEDNNQTTSDAAWVYDRFKNVVQPSEDITTNNVMQMFEEFERQLPPENEDPEDYLFRLVPVDTFDSGEQITFLIEKGRFYYAKEKV